MAQKIIIIGGGIIGAATAWNLARAGADVTVLDAGGGATGASFGWVNASYYANEDHFRLRLAGMQAWDRLASVLDVPVLARGAIAWDQTGPALEAQFKTLQQLGYPVECLDAKAFAALEPQISNPLDDSLYFPSEVVVDAGAVAQKMLQRSGARVLRGMRADGIDPSGMGVTVTTPLGPIVADQVIVAAGTASQGLVVGFDASVPLRPSPTLVLQTAPVAQVCSHVLASPVGDIRQRADGVFIMPTDVNHQGNDSAFGDQSLDEVEANALHRIRSLFPDLGLKSAGLTLAHRPMPQDGLPIVGPVHDRVYTAVMHSGVTLGALMGELVGAEVLTGPTNATQNHLAPYRPTRFLG